MPHDTSYGYPASPGDAEDDGTITTWTDAEPDAGGQRRLDLFGLLVLATLVIGLCAAMGGVFVRPSPRSADRVGVPAAIGIIAAPRRVAFGQVDGATPAYCSAPVASRVAWMAPVPAVDETPAARCADVISLDRMVRPTVLRWL